MNLKDYKIINNCRLCDSPKMLTVYDLNSTTIGDDYTKNLNLKAKKYELKLKKCEICNFVQLSNVIDPDLVYGDYLYVTKTSSGLPEHFKKITNKLFKKKILKKNAQVLEIGSNDCTLLEYIKKKGANVIGVDPAKSIKINNSIKVYKNLFNYKFSNVLKKKYHEFDCIIANNVIANIDDLNDTFKGIKNLMKFNSFIVIETFSLYGLIKNNLIDNIYHEHLSYFSIKNFNRFLKKFNLKIVEVEIINVKGGSLRFIISHLTNKSSIKSIIHLRKSINLEKKEKIHLKSSFNKIKKINSKNALSIKKFIKRISKKKKIICGYGASVGTTTLINYYGLNSFFRYIFDDERKRHNLYLPGSRIKVLSSKKIEKIKPDYIFIFAWRYAKLIIKKNKNYIKNGGTFIIPLPKFKLIRN